MYLLTLVLVFAVIGYLLAGSRLGERVDRASDRVTDSSRSWVDKAEASWRSLFKTRSRADGFRDWAAGPGADSLPDDFKDWLAALSTEEAREFASALTGFAHSLGFNLDTLVDGGLDQQPILRQVFVETIVVYSDAYRKAKQALKEAKGAKVKTPETSPSGDGKKPARKRASRRKREPAAEAVETASAA
jgi:hypothetical protein